MALAPAGYKVNGIFTERTYQKEFEYCELPDDKIYNYGREQGATHLIYVNDVIGWPYRYAKVKKTVVYVAVEEDDNGNFVWEKWNIKNHKDIHGNKI